MREGRTCFHAGENDPAEREKLLMQEEGMTERTKSLTSQRDGIQSTSGGIRLVGQVDFLCRNKRRGMQVYTRFRFAGEEIRDITQRLLISQ